MNENTQGSGAIHVESVEAFVVLATGLSSQFGMHTWYRGQADASWNLKPAVARSQRRPGHEPNRSIHFMNRARTRHGLLPVKEDLAGWLFLMQHFGLETRLLDWTEAPLVALYFAVEKDSAADAAVFALDPHRLNATYGHAVGLMLPHHPQANKLITPAFRTGEPISEVAAILPAEIDYRMMLQRSVFTVHGDTAALDEHPKQDQFLKKMIVPSAHRSRIKKQLHALGIDRAHLFPDLSNLASYLNEGTGGAT